MRTSAEQWRRRRGDGREERVRSNVYARCAAERLSAAGSRRCVRGGWRFWFPPSAPASAGFGVSLNPRPLTVNSSQETLRPKHLIPNPDTLTPANYDKLREHKPYTISHG